MATVLEATNASIEAANWITDADKGTVEVLRHLARTIDHPDFPVIDGKFDNVSIPTYLRFAAALGLTPASRPSLGGKGEAGANSQPAGTSTGGSKPTGVAARRRTAQQRHLRPA